MFRGLRDKIQDNREPGDRGREFRGPRPKKDVLFIIGDWNAKVGSQETPGVTGKFGFGIRNKEGKD